jgi:hypothetical protein
MNSMPVDRFVGQAEASANRALAVSEGIVGQSDARRKVDGRTVEEMADMAD